MTVMIKSEEKKAQEEAARNHKVAFCEVETKNAFRWNGKVIDFYIGLFRERENCEESEILDGRSSIHTSAY
jgi:hypothetical protein